MYIIYIHQPHFRFYCHSLYRKKKLEKQNLASVVYDEINKYCDDDALLIQILSIPTCQM